MRFLKRCWLWLMIPLVCWYISTSWYQLMLVQGRSMVPFYHHFQLVVLDKHSEEYSRGRVVAFSCEGLSTILVKRIVACPRDTAVIRNGTLFVNESISEVYPETERFRFSGALDNEIKLEEGQYLVLGDNIEESIDSRYPEVGIVTRENILGIVCGS